MRDMVSVIITTHERDVHIVKRAIDSAINQTYSEIEIIVVNDSPNYEKKNELESMILQYAEKNVRYIFNDRKMGACASRNIGIENAKGKYIALLDDDDTFENTKLEKMLPLFSDEVAMVYSDYKLIQNGLQVSRKKLPVYEGAIFDHLLVCNFIGGCSIPVIQKTVFSEVGGFDEEFPSAQDIDMWLRIAKKYKVRYIDEELVNYYVSDVAITTNPKRRIAGWKRILEKYEADFNLLPQARIEWQNNIIEILLQYNCIREGIECYSEYYMGIERLQNMKIIIRGLIKNILYNLGIRER